MDVVVARTLVFFAIVRISTSLNTNTSTNRTSLSGLLHKKCFSPAPDQASFDIQTYERNIQHAASMMTKMGDCCNHYYRFITGDAPLTVYAIGLCRGDIGDDRCLRCLELLFLQQLYPLDRTQTCTHQGQTEGIIWYAECMFRYANRPILDAYELLPGYRWSNYLTISANQTYEQPIVYSTLNDLWSLLAKQARAGDFSRKFAAGVAGNSSGGEGVAVHATVQCDPNLSPEDCWDCLQLAFFNYTSPCCVGTQGFVLMPCCSFMYDTLLFFNASTSGHLSTNPPRPSFTLARMADIHVIISATVVAFLTFICTFVCFLSCARRKFQGSILVSGDEDEDEYRSFQFPYDTIRTATDDFHQEIGRGGFGPVYKGKLVHGPEIAVKKLSHKSAQGDKEFGNEVRLLAKIQHRNLVRLLGFSSKNEDRLLIYEYLPNGSLDFHLFDPIKRVALDWVKRYNIIRGIARGIMYLHEDSRLKIIHCDLKAGNILLDEEMNAKISDFGLAKLFEADQSYKHTERFAGTFGYAAPEYVIEGFISTKSDVYSFGIIVLEIITGLQNSKFQTEDEAESLISYVWKNWNANTFLDAVDPVLLATSIMQHEIKRCTHIALICIEENASGRPTMTQVVAMLSNSATELRRPSQPAFMATDNSFSAPAAQFIQILQLAEFEKSEENQKEQSGSAAV